jgi:hypothetical protein
MDKLLTFLLGFGLASYICFNKIERDIELGFMTFEKKTYIIRDIERETCGGYKL